MAQKQDSSSGASKTSPPPLGPSPEVREVLYRAFALGLVIILGLIVVIAAVFSIGSGMFAAPAGNTLPVPTTTVPVTTIVSATTTIMPPTTSAVDMIPENMYVGVSVEKSSAGAVTVNFLGGEGRALVKEIQAQLTRSDSTIVTGTMDPQADSPQIILAGTKGTDHIEVFARMYSGKLYKIADQKVTAPVRIGSR
jgi:hypothetical protein